MKLKRLTHTRKLSGRLYDKLEGMILNGDLKTGDRLPTEAILCEQLGVSRTSLREALQQLKGRGLIESTAGRGMFVRSIAKGAMEKEMRLFAQVEEDPEAFFELVDLRLMIEPETARIAAKSVTPELVKDLGGLLQEMRSNLDNRSAFMEADLDMHLRIAEEAGNRFIGMLLCCMKPLSKRFGHISHGAEGFMESTFTEHQAIVNAIEAADSRKAHKAMRDHLISSRDHFLKNLKQSTA